jgi:cation-transporting P-type ATPase F
MNEIKGLEFDNKTNWYMLSVENVAKKLKSDTNKGLSDHECKTRRAKFGKNVFQPKKKKSLILKFLQGFNQPLIYILLIAGTITLFLKEFIEAGVIYGVTIINAIIGFIQEAKAENAIAALVKSVKIKAAVIRNGKKIEISASELVPGDIVLLSSGVKVPADLRIIEVKDLQTNEAFLTGESMPVSKTQKTIQEKKDVADRNNIAYAGSLVTYGTGKGIVVAIGNETQTGQISKLIDESEGLKTPFMIKIEKFSKTLLYIILSLAVITFLISLFKGLGWVEGFKGAVALAVSAIPEGLPAIVTVTLAIGVSRMAGKHAKQPV